MILNIAAENRHSNVLFSMDRKINRHYSDYGVSFATENVISLFVIVIQVNVMRWSRSASLVKVTCVVSQITCRE